MGLIKDRKGRKERDDAGVQVALDDGGAPVLEDDPVTLPEPDAPFLESELDVVGQNGRDPVDDDHRRAPPWVDSEDTRRKNETLQLSVAD